MSKLPFEGIRVADFGWIIPLHWAPPGWPLWALRLSRSRARCTPTPCEAGFTEELYREKTPAFNCTGASTP